jgi:osmotically inducible protein OsmC
MSTFSRHATVNWQGPIMEGRGDLRAGSGAFSVLVSFPRRIGEPEGVTSPEELMAAAHAACYAMAFSATLGRKGGKARRTDVTATVTAERGDAGITIRSSKLTLAVEGLEGVDASAIDDIAREAEGKCPVSNAYRGTMTITVEATVR